MKLPLPLAVAAGVCVAGLGGYAVLHSASPSPETQPGTVASRTTLVRDADQPATSDQPGQGRPHDDDDHRAGLDDDHDDRYDDDDDRPYRNTYRQVDAPGRIGPPANAGPACRQYQDEDADGVCDSCARTPRGCSAGPNAEISADPYPGMPTTQDYERQSTLENMQAAFNGESNAQAKYLAFAEKAEEDGYAGVAALFRAAAEAEGFHAANQAEVIRQLGGKAEAKIEPVSIGTTRENLESAIEGESYEWDVMYPGMLSRARLDRARAAIRSFNFAMTAERDHARFYRAALADLDGWQEPRAFFVCTVCGETVDRIDFKKCPSCFVKVGEYVRVD